MNITPSRQGDHQALRRQKALHRRYARFVVALVAIDACTDPRVIADSVRAIRQADRIVLFKSGLV
jgi:hypothetical protein